ncbi:Hsp33 family molecular chaperone HslO [Bacillota bacterium HCP28S3_F12]
MEEQKNRKQNDYMIRGIAANNEIRCFAITGRDLVDKARLSHGTSPVATAALGRTMMGALMMSDMLKNDEDLLTIRFDGDGPLGAIVVTADHHGNVKGYVQQPLVMLPLKADGHLDVGRAVGKGTLTVIRDLDLKDTYNGQIAIHSGEIADDLTHYFAESEQIPSSVGLGVLVDTDHTVKKAGGFLIQLMPFASDETISRLEKNLSSIRYVTEMLEDGMTPEDMLREALNGFDDLRITDTTEVQFFCNCSRDRVSRALALLGDEELTSMIRDQKPVELFCSFCGRKYEFSVAELEQIKAEAQHK